ncbi:amidohydrolase family protein [Paraburkholderia acidisoli]|uniref:Amidohydrolase family protein n=1 Tax=Paraburkholderia acidisoli TaxID=2571748 RepID=A0A7Z2GPP7_9BURK|nr:amidohydrolase family protein [Paraburkholderia acidisoli]QGZ65683.1 amidohydrolase family protein [Paraburkholderia acidisoli]
MDRFSPAPSIAHSPARPPALPADPFDGLSPASRAWLDEAAPRITGIDTHAHIFVQGLPLAAQRRHAPDYDATLDQYVAQLAAHGMSQGVLVQPSFLGTDNTFLRAVCERHPQRFRGVAVVAPEITEAELAALDAAHIVGARLNLIGLALPDFHAPRWTALFARLNALRWHVEVQANAVDLPAILDALLGQGCTVVVDHFGRPDLHLGAADAGFRYLQSVAASGRVWVKLSAAYRSAAQSNGTANGGALAAALLESFGAKRLVWGSDWPHTQHRHLIDYDGTVDALAAWIPDRAARETVLTASAVELFRFQTSGLR